MGIFDKLFGKKSKELKVKDLCKEKGEVKEKDDTFTEKDNMGTRHDTLDIANTYWGARISSPKKDPFVLYAFNNEKDAREALLELPCIHVAEDSQKLICTNVLIFGYYSTGSQQDQDRDWSGIVGKYEAIVCGDELTHELWMAAKDSFAKHDGQRKSDHEPEKRTLTTSNTKKAKPDKITFVREDHKSGLRLDSTNIYRIYNGPDAASAKAFLQKNPVNKKLYYIIVETPEGNYCRDIMGIYKE